LNVPAKKFGPLIASVEMIVFMPESTAFQVAPLSVLRKAPSTEAAKRFVPLTARELTVPTLTDPSSGGLVRIHCAHTSVDVPRESDKIEVISKNSCFMKVRL
jgi:hypothetical protein